MSGAVEVFLDETPGETRGAVMRDGRYTHLLIHRDDDAAQTRLGARSIGRVTEVNQGLRGAFVEDDAFLQLFARESRIAAQLDHENCVRVLATGNENGEPFIAMEYLEGLDLQELWSRGAARLRASAVGCGCSSGCSRSGSEWSCCWP